MMKNNIIFKINSLENNNKNFININKIITNSKKLYFIINKLF